MSGVALFHRYFLAIVVLTEMSVSRNSLPNFKRNFKPRVIEGYPDVNNKYPYVVTLELKFPHVPQFPFFRTCTGSLISSHFVITAAHCMRPDLHFVRCENMTLPVNESTCLSKILTQIPHPSYGEKNQQNDIALLHIEKLVMSRYGRLNFADFKTFLGRAVKYAGFGSTRLQNKNLKYLLEHQKHPLQIGEGVILNDEDTATVYPSLLIAAKCLNKKQQAFEGDSGGPLFVDNKIAGVCRGGVPYTRSHPPSFTYTPISPYVNWIREAIVRYENK